ncbi:MAG: hypothetical protein ACYCYG_07215, partial [Bellilinea sp.]
MRSYRSLIVSVLLVLLTACSTAGGLPNLNQEAEVVLPTQTPLPSATAKPTTTATITATATATPTPTPHPLTMQAMRSRDYPGSDILIEQTLDPG